MYQQKRSRVMPVVGSTVVIKSPVTEEDVTGIVKSHLSSQWVMEDGNGWERIIHKNWEWEYADGR